MALDDSDKEWFTLTLENAQLKAFEKHKTEDHAHLEDRVSRLSGKVTTLNHWIKGIGVAALGALGINIPGSH